MIGYYYRCIDNIDLSYQARYPNNHCKRRGTSQRGNPLHVRVTVRNHGVSMSTIINSKLPDFKVQAYHQDSFKTVTQNDLIGKWSVLFFYPADFTFVCLTELGDMADQYDVL